VIELPTEAEPVRVIEGDSLDVLRQLPDGCVDAVVTDPPYCSGGISEAARTRAAGQGLRSENIRRFGWFTGDNMGTAGLAWLLRTVAVESRRVVKPSGSLLVFCDWKMHAAIQPAVESAGLRYQGLVVWDKGSMGLGTGFRCQHELVLHYTYGAPEYHAADVGNVVGGGRVRAGDREHQTQKPVALMRQLLRVVAPPGGLILDPFAGSGSTAVAAVQLGMRCVGVEQDSEHCETARRRVAEAMGGALLAGV
jgi:site-specific DNA-methyltransferase (adenine-specific)